MLISVIGFTLLFLLPRGAAVILHNGTYLLCASSAEETAMHQTRMIEGGVNTLHQVEREPCERLTWDRKRYRTYDGTCNDASDRGASFSLVKRLAPHYYQGEQSEPRQRARSGRQLPSPRAVSLEVHRASTSKTYFSLMLMQFGQFLDHDLTLAPVATDFDETIKCCDVPVHSRSPACFPIENPDYDHLFSNCTEFVRTEPLTLVDGTVPNPRKYFNAITAWLDASSVYGSDREKAKELRTKDGAGALLKISKFRGEERLPKGHDKDCVNVHPDHFCALAGDDRVNEQPGLTAIHLVFHKEHNRLVMELVKALLLKKRRPFSRYYVERFLQTAPPRTQEQLYQTVRKVLGAVWQKIVYDEYLPQIIGPELMDRYHLWVGHYVPYDPYLDPSISLEFLTAAFRYGHTLINNFLITDKRRLLKDLFSTSSHNLEHYRSIVAGLVSKDNHAGEFDPNMPESITDHLFQNTNGFGLDLPALNIQRGRDHAIPSYNLLRKHLGLKENTHWSDFGECANGLKNVYEHPDDVDTFTGGTCERSLSGGVVGELFGEIIARQFRDLKFGDKYFFESHSSFYGFTKYELRAIYKMTFSKILCENAALDEIQEDPFRHPHPRWNPVHKCSSYRDLDMWWWTYYIR
ncbi:chorion peroxidase-like [Babylonia areolata]|uniref:chorion peroxidase-like n=1 Tax=Babylonia areolata TaxID=304850 RepID=UPI003FCFFD8F